MIGNAHIDPMWIWAWDEGMHEVLQTFRAAADRLDEDPDLTFTASSASYYRWVMETSPELFARIRVLVDDGRWVVTGGQWVEPDCNLPAGESVCRQLLYGQRFLARHLGVTARIGYNVDSFGHAGSLPQLLAASGIGAYVFMRPGPDEKALPSPAFRWRGTDGTELPAYRIPIDYSTPSWAEEQTLRTRAAELLERSADLGIPLMGFFGVGDHGGGPTRLAMATVHALAAEHGGAVAFGDPEAYFEALEGTPGLVDALPVVEGELQWHAVGCYSVHADLKLANARAEDALVAAEAFTEMCRLLTGDAPDVRQELAAAWEGVLFAQFHDALGGTCTDGATDAVRALLVSGAARAEQLAVRAVHRVAEQVDTWVEGAEAGEGIESAITGLPVPMLVFNPHSWPVTASVSLPHALAVATDASGRRVAVQQVPSGEVTYSPRVAFCRSRCPRSATGATGSMSSIPPPVPRRARRPTRRGPATTGSSRTAACACGWTGTPASSPVRRARAVTSRRAPSSWRAVSARSWSPTTATPGRTASPATTGGRRRDGSCRSTWSSAARCAPPCAAYGRSATGGRSSPRRSPSSPGAADAEVRLDVDWHEEHRVLKLAVPLALDRPSSTAGAPYGSVGRPCSGHEEPMVHWVDLSGAADGWGLACLTEGAGGYDARGATLRLTVLRSPRVADHGRGWGAGDPAGYPFTDQGHHRVRYALVPHAGPAAGADLPRRAAEHRSALPVVLDTWHRGRLGPEASAVRLEGGGVLMPVLKRAEDGGGTVARLWEVAGSHRRVRLSLGPAADEPPCAWEGELRPHEVRTVFVPDGEPTWSRTVDIPELDVRPRAAADFAGLLSRHPELDTALSDIQAAFSLLARTVETGGTVYVGGNGGSAADAEHIVGELMKGMDHRRPLGGPARAALRDAAPGPLATEADYLAERLEGALRAVCLTSQSGLLSAVANDTAGDMGMAQQVHGYGRPGDVFWALSTSGRSRNVVLAALAARAAGCASWP